MLLQDLEIQEPDIAELATTWGFIDELASRHGVPGQE